MLVLLFMLSKACGCYMAFLWVCWIQSAAQSV